jgi:hypothetical protein
LGAVWLGCHNEDAREKLVRDVAGIPAEIGVLSLISVGRPGESKPARTQYDPERVHVNHW